jgi:hypothetical protein
VVDAARLARLLGHLRKRAAARQHVDQRRLAHVGPADHGKLGRALARALVELDARFDVLGRFHAHVGRRRQRELQRRRGVVGARDDKAKDV